MSKVTSRRYFLSGMIILLVVLLASAVGETRAERQLVLISGQSRLLTLPEVSRVAVGDEQIVDVLVLSSQEILLNAKRQGITSLHVWSKNGQQAFQLRVAADDGTLVSEYLQLVDIDGLTAWFVEGKLVLDGTLRSPEARERAERLAEAYSSQVISLLRVDQEPMDQRLAEQIAGLIGGSVAVAVINDNIVLEGTVDELAEKERARRIAETFGRPVIDLVQVAAAEPAEVVTEDVADVPLPTRVAEAIDRPISIQVVNGVVFLEGTVKNELEKRRAREIAQAFSSPVVDLLQVSPPVREPEPELTPASVPALEAERLDEQAAQEGRRQQHLQKIRQLAEPTGISVRFLHEHLVLEGTAEDAWERERLRALVGAFPYPVIDLIRLPETAPAEEPGLPGEEEIEELIGTAGIAANWINRTLFLEGLADDEYSKRRALAIGQAFTSSVVDLIRVRTGITEIKTEQGEVAVAEPLESPSQEDRGDRDERIPQDAEEQAVEKLEIKEPAAQSTADFQQELIADLTKALRQPEVIAEFHRETLVLEGVVPSETAKDRAEKIASFYYQPVVSFLAVEQPPEVGIEQRLAEHLVVPSVEITEVDGVIVLEGTVQDQAEHSRVLEIARLYGEVRDLLHIPQPAQVLLQVMVVEMDVSAGEKLGLRWGSLLDSGEFQPNVIRLEEVGPIGSIDLRRSFRLAAEIEALADEGKARLLAAPSLLTASGDTAQFLAGGEIPVAVITADGPSIEWKEYGVRLEISPLVKKEYIDVRVKPEVSSLDWSNGTRLHGEIIPALRSRRTDTRVQVAEGSTLVLGGLIEREESTQIRKIPLLGDLPIIGALFRSKAYQENETELVIMITPWVVYPEGGSQDD